MYPHREAHPDRTGKLHPTLEEARTANAVLPADNEDPKRPRRKRTAKKAVKKSQKKR